MTAHNVSVVSQTVHNVKGNQKRIKRTTSGTNKAICEDQDFETVA